MLNGNEAEIYLICSWEKLSMGACVLFSNLKLRLFKILYTEKLSKKYHLSERKLFDKLISRNYQSKEGNLWFQKHLQLSIIHNNS
ncbi:CLUMA_CG002945, isoform A [Clunio marinus]|uniref:CLUMA_CG002945, isoform A n=1 Tax=Clunio marinus TaxID=568069 RepID=A0A1J1HM88_9DIPT|nr:CLUMA_CG002945, isoform A [Clunio marinus]